MRGFIIAANLCCVVFQMSIAPGALPWLTVACASFNALVAGMLIGVALVDPFKARESAQ